MRRRPKKTCCDLCGHTGPRGEFVTERDPETGDTLVSCRDREACALRLRLEMEELTSGYEEDADLPW